MFVFQKIWRAFFLETPVLRFAFLLYYRRFETLQFRPFLKINLTFANLKEFGNLFKDIERLQISVTGLARTSTPSFKHFSGNLSMTAAFVVSISLKIFSMFSFSAGSKLKFLVISTWLKYWANERFYSQDGYSRDFQLNSETRN